MVCVLCIEQWQCKRYTWIATMAIDMLHILLFYCFYTLHIKFTSFRINWHVVPLMIVVPPQRCTIKWKREQSMHLIKASKSNRNMQYSSFGLITISLHCMNCAHLDASTVSTTDTMIVCVSSSDVNSLIIMHSKCQQFGWLHWILYDFWFWCLKFGTFLCFSLKFA